MRWRNRRWTAFVAGGAPALALAFVLAPLAAARFAVCLAAGGEARNIKETLRHRLRMLLPLLMLTVAVGIKVGAPGAVEEAQLRVFDLYQRLRPRDYQPMPVRIIDIDDESLERIG